MKIAIVEDERLFRDVLRKACAADLGHEVVGEAGTGQRGARSSCPRRCPTSWSSTSTFPTWTGSRCSAPAAAQAGPHQDAGHLVLFRRVHALPRSSTPPSRASSTSRPTRWRSSASPSRAIEGGLDLFPEALHRGAARPQPQSRRLRQDPDRPRADHPQPRRRAAVRRRDRGRSSTSRPRRWRSTGSTSCASWACAPGRSPPASPGAAGSPARGPSGSSRRGH